MHGANRGRYVPDRAAVCQSPGRVMYDRHARRICCPDTGQAVFDHAASVRRGVHAFGGMQEKIGKGLWPRHIARRKNLSGKIVSQPRHAECELHFFVRALRGYAYLFTRAEHAPDKRVDPVHGC